MIENDIATLLDAPARGAGAPTLAQLEDALTTGYARALALEAEQRRLQRYLGELAGSAGNGRNPTPAAELRRLGQRLDATRADLTRLRTLLLSLRGRAAAARAA